MSESSNNKTKSFKNLLSTQPKIFKYWFTLTLVFGVILVFLIPPFQSPDEFHHFYRIYQITDGHLLGEFNSDSTQIGGYMPQSVVDIMDPYDEPLVFKTANKTSLDTLLKCWNTPLNAKNIVFREFPNTARYSITAYLPQVVAFELLKIFESNPLKMMYLGRLFNFIFWFICVCFAVMIMPKFKELAMIFLFLPDSISINASLSADVTSNALLFLAFALFFRFRYNEKIKPIELFLFAFIIFITTLNKIIYFPIILLLLFVQNEKFKSIPQKILIISSGLIANFLLGLEWSHIVNGLIYPNPNNLNITTYENIHTGFRVNPTQQIHHILEYPLLFFKNWIYESLRIITTSTTNSWIGDFGWDGFVPSGLGLILFYFIIIFSTAQNYIFKLWERFGLALIGFSMSMLIILVQHLHWDEVGDYFDNGYEGKYFIPIFPFYFWSVAGIFSKKFESEKRRKILNIVFLALFGIVYIDFWILVFLRFYIPQA